jgi:hypothetical protein
MNTTPTIDIKLSKLLGYEIYAHTVETGLVDHVSSIANGGPNYLSDRDYSLYLKIEKDCYNLKGLTLPEASALYDELYNLVDLVEQWADEEGVRWYGVLRAIRSNMKKLRDFGVQTNERGWAI